MKKYLPVLLLLALFCLPPAALAQDLRVDFYDVGKADAMLITTPDGAHILIDTGTNKAGKMLCERFKQEGISTIDLMLITHFDKDHVGGADKILEEFSVSQVVIPDYSKESKQLDQFTKALEESPDTSVTKLPAKQSLSFTYGSTSLLLSAAQETFYGADEENDFSIAARLTYGDTRFLFTGDAEDARQKELLAEGDLACDVLKVPYHGRLVEASEDFLRACSPKIAFIPDSEEEPSHPYITELLKNLGTDVHSAQDGDLTVLSDGKAVRIG